MNGLLRYWRYILAAFILPAFFVGCTASLEGDEGDPIGDDDDDDATLGTLHLQVAADQGRNLREVRLDVAAIEVRSNAGDWMTAKQDAGMIYLVRNGAQNQTVAQADLAPGKYSAVGFEISGASVIDGAGDEIDLTLLSSRIEIVTEFCLTAGRTTTVLLDFNAEDNIQKVGTIYSLVPNVTVSDGESCRTTGDGGAGGDDDDGDGGGDDDSGY